MTRKAHDACFMSASVTVQLTGHADSKHTARPRIALDDVRRAPASRGRRVEMHVRALRPGGFAHHRRGTTTEAEPGAAGGQIGFGLSHRRRPRLAGRKKRDIREKTHEFAAVLLIGLLTSNVYFCALVVSAQQATRARSGQVRADGRAVADAAGPFNALGATLFWGGWA